MVYENIRETENHLCIFYVITEYPGVCDFMSSNNTTQKLTMK